MNFVILIPLGLVAIIVLLFIIFRVDDDSIDNFMGKVYKSAYDANKKDAMKKLKKKDPKTYSAMEQSQKLSDDYRKNVFNKMSKKKQEKTVKEAMDYLRNLDKD
tara:strand:+ start:161 stop:472 length:312 start_codon:yes stop_codon:yes gene_type:complete